MLNEENALYYDFDPFPLSRADVDELNEMFISPGWKLVQRMYRFQANVSGTHAMDRSWPEVGTTQPEGQTLPEHRAYHRAIYKARRMDLNLEARVKAVSKTPPVPADELPIDPGIEAPEL